MSPGWHYFAGTFDGPSNKSAWYLDGQLVRLGYIFPGASNIDYPSTPPWTDLTIGTRFPSFDFFNGTIDEVRVYNRALSAAEIANLYSISSLTNAKGLVYTVSKDRCPYAGGDVQSLTFPFAYNNDQDQTGYYTAVLKAWPRGAS